MTYEAHNCNIIHFSAPLNVQYPINNCASYFQGQEAELINKNWSGRLINNKEPMNLQLEQSSQYNQNNMLNISPLIFARARVLRNLAGLCLANQQQSPLKIFGTTMPQSVYSCCFSDQMSNGRHG